MHKRHNPVAKFSAQMQLNAGVHEKSNKAKRKNKKQNMVQLFRQEKENYLMSQLIIVG